MKKLILPLALVAFLATGCNSSQTSQLSKDKDCQNYADAMSNKIGQRHTVYRIFYSQSLAKCLYAYEIDSPIDQKQTNPLPENTDYYFAIRDEVTFEPVFEKTFYGFDRSVYRYMNAGDFDVVINGFK
jgi:hypothetical protein